jgi:hypothetical protein
LPDFLVILWRGDLSDIAGPLIWGPVLVPTSRPYAHSVRRAPMARPCRTRVSLHSR